MKELTFYIYWLHGSMTELKGTSVTEAFRRAGLGAGAIRAVDFFQEDDGTGPSHVYNIVTKSWERKVPLITLPTQGAPT